MHIIILDISLEFKSEIGSYLKYPVIWCDDFNEKLFTGYSKGYLCKWMVS